MKAKTTPTVPELRAEQQLLDADRHPMRTVVVGPLPKTKPRTAAEKSAAIRRKRGLPPVTVWR